MHAFLASVRFQGWSIRRNPGDLLMLVTGAFFTVIFVSITLNADRPDLLGHAVLAPILIQLWMTGVTLGGEIIDRERSLGTLEATVAAPANLQTLVLGRIVTITGLGLVPVAEVWLVTWVVFGVVPPLHHPAVFVVGIVATSIAMACTTTIFAALFVLARSAVQFTNAMGYPFYILAGLMVPVAMLPEWLQPLSRAVFLSWSADLLRDALSVEPVADVGLRVAVILALGAAGYVVGRVLLRAVLDRVRALGTTTYA